MSRRGNVLLSIVMTLTATVLLLAANGQETPIPLQSEVQILTEPRNLLSLKIVKGEPIKLYVLGAKKAELHLSALNYKTQFNPSDLSVIIHRTDSNQTSQPIKIERKSDHFIIVDPIIIEENSILELEAKTKNKKEVFKFKLKTPLP